MIRSMVVASMLISAQVLAADELTPVLVAAVDISAGTVVTLEMISQRSIPKKFITSSIVRPDSASLLINQRLRFSISAGELLPWAYFDVFTPAETVCRERIVPDDGFSEDVAKARLAILKRAKP